MVFYHEVTRSLSARNKILQPIKWTLSIHVRRRKHSTQYEKPHITTQLLKPC